MSHEKARALIIKSWKDVWMAGVFAEMPVRYNNRKKEIPKGATWGRLTLMEGDADMISLGTKDERTPFVLTFQVFIPEDKGEIEAYQVRDVLAVLNREAVRDGNVTAHFGVFSCQDAPQQDGTTAFNVTARGHFDIYRAS